MNAIKVEIGEKNAFCFDNCCLICLQPVINSNKEEQINSLNILLNYLKVRERVKSVVCGKCVKIVSKLANLFNILEKVNLEMDYLFNFIQTTISNSNQSCQPATVFSSVRDMIIKRCGKQLKCPNAEVILDRVENSNGIKTKSPSPDCSSAFPAYYEYNGTTYLDTNEVPATPIIKEIKTIKMEVQMDNYFPNKSSKKKRDEKKAKCPKCSTILGSNRALKQHINIVHLRLKPFSCSTCFKEFSQISNLRYHVDSVHLRLKPYKCDMCDKSFTTAKCLRRHKAMPHDPKPEIQNFETFHCEKCVKDFSSKEAFDKHHLNVHSGGEFPCLACNKVFKRRHHLERHFAAVHDKQRNYCQKQGCNKSYSNPSHLLDHYKLSHPGFAIPGKPVEGFYSDKFTVINKNGTVECALCRGHFKHAHSVKQHLKYFHGCAQFKCQDCGYGTLLKEKLNNHIEQKHKTRRVQNEENEDEAVVKIESDLH